MDVGASVWAGAKSTFLPVLALIAVVIVLRAIAWLVKAKRGY